MKRKKFMKLKFDFLDFYNILLLIFLFLPILIIVLFSFNASRAGSFPMAGFSIKWYKEVLTNPSFLSAIKNSVFIATGTAIIATIIGTLASFGLTRYNFRFKNITSFLVLLPISVPALLIGISLLSYFNILNIILLY